MRPPGGYVSDVTPPAAAGNPYLKAWHRRQHDPGAPGRDELLAQFGFAVPDDRAMQVIADHSPHGVVEVGAGLGYWARLLADRGIDVAPYDIAPPPSPDNHWFAGIDPWFPVTAADERVVAEHPDGTLLLVWPTRNETWGADAALLHAASGGQRLVYVGEPPGGRTGDAALHAVLGLVDRCLACAYGVLDVPCTCGVTEQWRLIEERPLPSWEGWDDRLYLFGPTAAPVPRRRGLRFSAVRRERRGTGGRSAEPAEAGQHRVGGEGR